MHIDDKKCLGFQVSGDDVFVILEQNGIPAAIDIAENIFRDCVVEHSDVIETAAMCYDTLEQQTQEAHRIIKALLVEKGWL